MQTKIMAKRVAEFDVQRWLCMLGLEDYTNRFESNGYHSFEDLLGLTENGLKHMGVVYSGDRDRLLRAIESLKSQSREAATQDLLVSV